MSGHSKWKNIMHKKEKTDAQRAKVFTKIGKEIAVAVKAGGPDPVANSKLKELISKAESDAETLKDKALSDANDDAEELRKAAEVRADKARETAEKQLDREIKELAGKADSLKEKAVSAVIHELID